MATTKTQMPDRARPDVRTVILLTPDQHRAYREHTEQTGESMSLVIRKLTNQWIKGGKRPVTG